MSAAGERLAEAARSLLGAPFRLHGRDPLTGLDCVGLLACALARIEREATLPAGYGLRNRCVARYLSSAPEAGFGGISGPVEAGDVLLVRSGPLQHHLVIAGEPGLFVHAHAGLRRVVASPAPLPWPTERHWRLLS